ncbi:ABC transporter permease [Microbacterium yannicii]|uniref:ABC transporter permease n=1 Tax=Microbacterium yannicii TaxID=671622 RepID=UPI000313A59F|nr:ABC transporter permease [Microbacterium yannicii]
MTSTQNVPPQSSAEVVANSASSAARSHSTRGSGGGLLERYGLIGIFIAVAIVFAVLRPETFAQYTNFRSLSISYSVLAIAALALIVPLVAGRFDISVGANIGMSSIVAASAMSRFDLPLWVAVLAGIATGALVGVINGVLVAYLGVNAIIGTLGVSIILQGLMSAYTGGIPISSGLDPALTNLSVSLIAGIPTLFIIMILVAVITWFLLRQTPYGRYLEAVGSNLAAARLTGIPAKRIVFLSFVIAGSLAGVAGVLQIGAQGNADAATGTINFILPALAAAFLGATTWRPGTYNVGGTIIALYFLAMVVNGLSLLGVRPWVTDVFNGAAVIVAIVVSAQLRRRRTGSIEIGQ